MRFTLVSPAIWGGGVERVACLLASCWAQQGKEITLLSLDHEGTQTFPIHPSVSVKSLGLAAHSRNLFQGLFRNLRRVQVLRRAIRDSQPDMVISLGDTANIVTLLATRGLATPVVICEGADPSGSDLSPLWSRFRRLMYPWASKLICSTSSGLAGFQAMTRVHGQVIPCLVAVPARSVEHNARQASTEGQTMVAMGRLVYQKGFDMLLNAFARVADRHPGWSLKIIGNGPLRSTLESQAKELKLGERVVFTGEVADPFPLLYAADLFVFSSRFEGFGLALCEAMACGLPVVSFDCPSGPGQIIRSGVDGILVPAEDTAALASALDGLMRDHLERTRFAACAPSVLERFGADNVLLLWQQLVEELLPARGCESLRNTTQKPRVQQPIAEEPGC